MPGFPNSKLPIVGVLVATGAVAGGTHYKFGKEVRKGTLRACKNRLFHAQEFTAAVPGVLTDAFNDAIGACKKQFSRAQKLASALPPMVIRAGMAFFWGGLNTPVNNAAQYRAAGLPLPSDLAGWMHGAKNNAKLNFVNVFLIQNLMSSFSRYAEHLEMSPIGKNLFSSAMTALLTVGATLPIEQRGYRVLTGGALPKMHLFAPPNALRMAQILSLWQVLNGWIKERCDSYPEEAAARIAGGMGVALSTQPFFNLAVSSVRKGSFSPKNCFSLCGVQMRMLGMVLMFVQTAVTERIVGGLMQHINPAPAADKNSA